MQITVSRIKASQLEIGSLYISNLCNSNYMCISIYLGKNFKNYFVYYNLCNIRYEVMNTAPFPNLSSIDIGTERMLAVYKDVVKEELSKEAEPEYFTILSAPIHIFNKIDLGLDTSAFVERNKNIWEECKIKVVKPKEVKIGEYYLDSSYNYLYQVVGTNNGISSVDYSVNCSAKQYVPVFDEKGVQQPYKLIINTTEVCLGKLPKVYRLTDVMQHNSVRKEFQKANDLLYQYALRIYKKG